MAKRIVKRVSRLLASRVFRKLGARRVPTMSVHTKPIVSLVTTWDTRCGISKENYLVVIE